MATRWHVSGSRPGCAPRPRFQVAIVVAGALLLAQPAPAMASSPTAPERPRVHGSHVTTSPGTPVAVVLTGRSGARTLAFSIVDGVDHGTLGPLGPAVCVLRGDSCSVVLRYTPDAGTAGLSDSLAFRATDPRGRHSGPATVDVEIGSRAPGR